MYSGLLLRFCLEQAYRRLVRTYWADPVAHTATERSREAYYQHKKFLRESLGDYMMEELSNWYDNFYLSIAETEDARRHEAQYR